MSLPDPQPALRAIQGSVALWVVALALPSVIGPTGAGLGLEMAALGWLGPLGFQVGWFGNPLLVATWIGVGRWAQRQPDAPDPRRVTRVVVAALGLVIAATALATLPGWDMFTPFTHGHVRALGPSVYVWLASFVLGLVGAVLGARRPPAGARSP